MDGRCLTNDEKAIFDLRELYSKYGYIQYKMSKFEEYDLYVRNKNFLVSDNIITFTDTDGKLMALKPDVTLSIVKNMKDTEALQKVYYNENVYRVSKGTLSFKEIMQVGLECIGDVDEYTIYEVMMLACESLAKISDEYVLDISHMGITSKVMKELNLPNDAEKKILKCISEKNSHGLCRIEKEYNTDLGKIKKMIDTYGTLSDVEPFLRTLDCKDETDEIIKIMTYFEKNGYKINFDFSIISDINYYNGFVFKGFINGIFSCVLSGGQYDNLMRKMKKSQKAIGFAVYLDMLEMLSHDTDDYDVDVVIVYDDKADIGAINEAVRLLSANGNSVTAQKAIPEKLRYRQLVRLWERGVQIIENNA